MLWGFHWYGNRCTLDSHEEENVVRDSCGNVAVFYFHDAPAATSEFAAH